MPLPFFYIENIQQIHDELALDEDTSKHVAQVLRMKTGERLNLTDGKGRLLEAVITDDNRKKCTVRIENMLQNDRRPNNTVIAISLLKNSGRFEWFLEKATEIGVAGIIPMICERTEKQRFREDRMKQILVSAMLQSQQAWIPELRPPMRVSEVILGQPYAQKFIAYCGEGKKISLLDAFNSSLGSQAILIGPEGDFTEEEIAEATRNHFLPITLGETRLRSETAGIVAAVLLTGK